MRVQKRDGECAERQVMGVTQFGSWSGLGRSKIYEEIRAKRLEARKCGDRTIITPEAREKWLRSLPVFGADPQIAQARKRKRAS